MIIKVKFLFKFLFFIFLLLRIRAQGGCFNDGIFLPKGTVWHSEPCSQCQCHSGVTVCQTVECLVPECNSGEDLTSLPHECCPVCLPKLFPCIEGTEEYKHGATWSLPPCLECQCYNGTVSCERLQCQIRGCPEGQVAVQSVGECCPQCVPSGRPCKFEAKVYEDGSIWSPISCTNCQCQNGLVQCYVAQCQSLSCPLNHTLETLLEECCPTCRGHSCIKDGTAHESGTTWEEKEDPCTHCSCTAGQINCFRTKCPALSCAEEQWEMTLKGKCCPECVRKTGLCTLEAGHEVPHGTEIKLRSQKCNTHEKSICYCHHGDVKCINMTCQRTSNCGHGMRLQDERSDNPSQDSCGRCPKCVPDLKLCLYERRPRKNRETWSVGCRLCECVEGRTSCYEPICPNCAEKISFTPLSPLPPPLSVPSSAHSCCPACSPALCPSECLSCATKSGGTVTKGNLPPQRAINAFIPAVSCTVCRDGFFLLEGRCVAACSGPTFPRGGRCLPCHQTCRTCAEGTLFHCTSCDPSLSLGRGECVKDCGRRFYSSRGECHPCHPTCEECSGVAVTDCQACRPSANLLNGSCVEKCPPHHVARRGMCIKCPLNCMQCGANECIECQPGFWRQNGECFKECQIGYFTWDENECQKCHSSCLSCNASGIASCTSCPRHLLQAGSFCVPSCPAATFRRDSVCIQCHSSCSECIHEGQDGCLKCLDANQKVLPLEYEHRTKKGKNRVAQKSASRWEEGKISPIGSALAGPCSDSCPDEYKLYEGVCLVPHDGCEEWHGNNRKFCLNCRDGFLSQNHACIEECSPGFYEKGRLCLECSPHCATCSDGGSNACESCATWASLHRRPSPVESERSSKNDSKCLTKCPKGHFFNPIHLSCGMCDSSCEDCATPSTGGTAVCVKCKRTNEVLEGERCVSSCSKGYFYSEEFGCCQKCHSSCLSCSGAGPLECTACLGGLFLTDENTCESNPCKAGFAVSQEGTCSLKCHADCHSCSPDDLSSCTSCLDGKRLLHGKCVDKCPQMYFSDLSINGECKECHWACQECQGPTADDCLRCGTGKLHQGNRCVTECSDGFYQHEDACLPCSGGCKKCTSKNECLACQSPYLLEKALCAAQCKHRYYSNIWENKCVECEANCRRCSMFECLECEEPLLSQNGHCVQTCDQNYYVDVEKSICYHNVDRPQLFVAGVLNAQYEGPTVLNTSLIHVFDADTQRERIFLIVEDTPSNGDLFILEEGDMKTKVKRKGSISYEAIEGGRVVFEYKKHKSFYSHVKFRASDGHFESENVIIGINVISNHSPEVTVLEPLIVRRGEKKTITGDNLRLRDADNPEAVSIRILDGPTSGRLTVFRREENSFTLQQLEELQVTYEHLPKRRNIPEDTGHDLKLSHNSDLILFQADDGYNYVNFLFSVIIVDSLKPPPVILKNRGARVSQRQRVQITNDLLLAKDLDSPDGDIVYSILPSIQRHSRGKFVLVIPLPTTPNGFINDGWIQMDESHLSRETTSFTQRDINEGRVWYVHSEDSLGFPEGSSELEAQYRDVSGAEYTSEEIVFSVSDSGSPPNVLGDQTFIVHVDPLPHQELDTRMELLPGAPLGITVLEGQAVTITPSHLAFSGVNSNDHLVYIITHPLGPNEGSLFHIDYPGLELRQFTQSDINDMKIIYMPPLEDLGEDERVISFKFIISDEMKDNQVDLSEQKFTIKILPMKEEMSLLHPSPQIVVSSRGTVELDSKYFQLKNSPDEEVEEVTVFLLEAPRYGSLSLITEADGRFSEDFTEETETNLRDVLNSRILYSNDGSKETSDSAFFLFLGSSSESTTRITFKILLEDNLDPRPDKNASFVLRIKEGETKIISSKIVHFTDFHSDDKDLVYTLSSQPMYGDLFITDDSGRTRTLNQTHKLSQVDISSGRLSYSSNVEMGIEPVVDNILLNVTDPSNNALANQLLRIQILPVDNKAPLLRVLDKIHVKEGGTVSLTHELITFNDVDSTMAKLKLVVDIPPVFGYITNLRLGASESKYKSNSLALPMPQFTIQDLVDGKLHYVQSQHRHQEPTSDSFRIHLTDGINESSDDEIKILIEPVNDETPVILGEQVSVERGRTITIQNISLFISDADTDADHLVVTIEQAPKHGTLHKKRSTTSSFKESVSIGKGDRFIFKDILERLVFYSQDGSKATEDKMEIKVSDGVQETGGLLEFLILPQKEKAPEMLVSKPLPIQRGQKATILPSILSATDEDSPDDDLVFVITVPAGDGIVQLYDDQDDQWKSLTLGSKFFQRDVTSGRVRYIHKNLKPELHEDGIRFHVQDPEGNVLLDKSLTVTIQEDETSPRVTVNKGMTVKELSLAVLSADVLSATDLEIDPMDITFRITETPSFGQLELIQNPEKSIKSWTQRDIELGSVRYRHTKYSSSFMDSFHFEVSDGINKVYQSFSITIAHVDEIPPYLLLKPLKVQEGTRKNISHYEIQATDPDTSDDLLTFEIRTSPHGGRIQKISDGSEITDTKVFTMQDIYEGRISYVHNGESHANDSFTITISDPFNKGYLHLESEAPVSEPSTIFVEVLSVSSGTPIITTNMGLQYLEHNDGKAQNIITPFELSTKDDGTSPDQLVYKITQPPEHGVLRLKTHTRPISTFTQALIDDGKLYYELTTFNEDLSRDEFVFSVSDQKSNTVSDNVFLISWSWIYMAQKDYNISESDGIVQIFINKSGNINRKSSVECSINNGSSHRGGKIYKRRKHESVTTKKEKKDYVPLSSTVEFGEGSTEKFCEVAIIDDDVLEGKEAFSVKLINAKYSLIGKPKKSVVTIYDEEDRPTLSFDSNHYTIEESEGFIFVPVKRSGDIQVAASAYCVTKERTAIGTNASMADPEADYVSKYLEESSKVVFPPRVKLSTCDVKLIDDSVFELDEAFELLLVNPSERVVVSGKNQTLITIKGPNDQSVLSFKSKGYEVVESSGKVRISIERSGAGLDHTASVWCASKFLSPEEAKPNSDFIPFSKQITFQPGQDEATFSINIIDDKGNPRYEGPESFIVFMSTPQNATLNLQFAEANVTIIDDEDIPSIQFEYSEMATNENDTVAKVPIVRFGDLSKPSSVRCFTRQRSAKGGIDFIERPNSEDSTLTFPIGVGRVSCEVNLLDDLVYEKEEDFTMKLLDSKYFTSKLSIGPNRVTKVSIEDSEDKPRVSFESLFYTTSEPKTIGEIKSFQVPLIRTGDNSKPLKVLVSTREGSALNDVNFKPLHKMVNFMPGITREVVNISILHSPSRQWNNAFRVVLGPEEPKNGELGSIISATVTIIDHHVNEASVLPSLPVAVSLLHYDTATEHYEEPASPGYPLICITSCEEQHPEYSRTQQLCEHTGFHRNSEMKYAWEVAVPGEGEDSLTPFHVLTESTLFGNSSSKVLDSMFFTRQFRVRCVVQPILESGHFGIPLRSKPIAVSSLNAICDQPGMIVGLQSQTFIAKLSYINFTDDEHPNTVKIDVKIPHQDGMVPLISTLPLHNIRYLLTDNLYRAHHTCSNLKPPLGFFESEENVQNISKRGSRPYQWDERLRKNETLNLYRHLNLRTCTWTFTAHYSMSQLVDECGGQIVSDFQVGSAGQSFLTVRVPLYLSYTYASPAPGWTSLDHRTELSVSLYYSTLLWNQGLHTEPTLTAKIQISRISLNSAGRLVIELSTIARYRGQFVMSHPLKPEAKSSFIASSNLNLNFTLELLWSAASWDGPEQVWRATSKYTLRDYTGKYLLQLVPCTVFPSQSYEYSDPPKCIPQNPANFSLPLSIQQIQQPVPLVYSLNTNFQLFKSREDFLMNPREVDNLEEIDYKGSFGPSQTVYGRVLWHPNQDLNSAYQLIIQRVFLCTGNDGYIPKYDPVGDIYNEGPQFGCIEASTKLKHRFLILDREVPHSMFNTSTPIEASFAEESPDYETLKGYPGVDGFLLQTDDLYKINSGYQWFLQVLYTIGPSQGNRGRREVIPGFNTTIDELGLNILGNEPPENDTELPEFYVASSMSETRNPENLPIPASLQTLHVRNGTNMRSFSLSLQKEPSRPTHDSADDKILLTSVLYVVLSLVFLVIVVMVVILLVRRHYSKQERDKVIVVRSLKNEREKDRRKDDIRTKITRPSVSPVTLNSESNLQTIKVKTLAVTVRNNLEEFGTEV